MPFGSASMGGGSGGFDPNSDTTAINAQLIVLPPGGFHKPGTSQPVPGPNIGSILMNGLHYSDTLAGRVFHQSGTPLGLAIPIYTATAIAGGMPIWNPPNSNRNIELIGADFDTASGTAVYGAIGLMALPLAAIATGALCTAFAATVPENGLLLSGNASRALSSNAGTVTVTAGVATPPIPGCAAPGWLRTLAQINGEGAAAGLAPGSVCHYDFQGTLIVPPGVMIYMACTLASVALICTGVTWKEIPINPQGG